MADHQIDVLICGGGPVGLVTAYCLSRYGLSTYIVEKQDNAQQAMLGRAANIAPRSLEILDQLDLADALCQIGFVVRGQKFYRDGKMIDNVSAPTTGITDTFFDHSVLCRQRYTEATIGEAYTKNSGNKVHYGAKLVDLTVSDELAKTIYPVSARLLMANGQECTVHSKYLVGADGASSTVRSLAGIPFPGTRNDRYWVRMDGLVRTDMPHSRAGICGLDSPTHGSILWACLDHGSTRVGFALPPHVWAEHGRDITLDVVIDEAKKALHPFSLEFDSVEWWTVYSVGQRLAQSYQTRGKVFLAGDAAHTHSSSGAQGMNIGIHDAVNLSWKLAGEIRGFFHPSVLASYELERRPVAQTIIEQDRRMSVLTGGEIPDELKDQGKDAGTLLGDIFRSNVKIHTGLGIEYGNDGIINVAPRHGLDLAVIPGSRAPDVMVQRPGPRIPVRLHSLLKNDALRFSILVFCGDPEQTGSGLRGLRSYLDGQSCFLHDYSPEMFRFLTIVKAGNENGTVDERLGCTGFGTRVYDPDASAHERYGVAQDKGALLVLRPDGTVGTAMRLEDGTMLREYFQKLLISGAHAGQAGDIDYSQGAVNGQAAISRGTVKMFTGEVEVEDDD
ncbi:MAG: hypothetical protein Q9220_006470 [cf. Caloplaca sp. 1 TL-2023]